MQLEELQSHSGLAHQECPHYTVPLAIFTRLPLICFFCYSLSIYLCPPQFCFFAPRCRATLPQTAAAAEEEAKDTLVSVEEGAWWDAACASLQAAQARATASVMTTASSKTSVSAKQVAVPPKGVLGARLPALTNKLRNVVGTSLLGSDRTFNRSYGSQRLDALAAAVIKGTHHLR